MGKGRDKQGREAKKKKKVKLPGGGQPAGDVQFRHHAVVTTPETPAKTE
jgi:hypothetical protein